MLDTIQYISFQCISIQLNIKSIEINENHMTLLKLAKTCYNMFLQGPTTRSSWRGEFWRLCGALEDERWTWTAKHGQVAFCIPPSRRSPNGIDIFWNMSKNVQDDSLKIRLWGPVRGPHWLFRIVEASLMLPFFIEDACGGPSPHPVILHSGFIQKYQQWQKNTRHSIKNDVE